MGDFKNNFKNMVVFSNGAVDRTKKNPPIFMRSSWAHEVKANCLFIDDKTIHDSKLRIGWGVGTQKKHYIDEYSDIIKKITSLMNINNKDVYYFGSSAGGFMSMLLASRHHNSTAIVNNPQTFVLNFNKGHVDELCEVIFPNMSIELIEKQFSERLNIVDALTQSKYIPPIFYFQNKQCERDIKTQFIPFVNGLKEKDVSEEKFTYIFYNDYVRGHTPMPREQCLNAINKIII